MRELEKFERAELDDELFGYTVAESSEYLLMASECDLIMDGYKIIGKQEISLRQKDDETRFSSKILELEESLEEINWDLALILTSMESALMGLKQLDEFVLLEDEEHVLIGFGQIMEVNESQIKLRPFDGAGGFEEAEDISLEDIFTISFGARYLKLNAKYSS